MQKHTQTISWLKASLYERGIRPNRRLGQNFLIDQNILQFIVNVGDINENDIVFEIGSGTGVLTQMLAERARNVVAVEIDKGLYEFGCETLAPYDNVTLINNDILKDKSHLDESVVSTVQHLLHLEVDQKDLNSPNLKVISNLPYCVSTPVIINLLQSDLPIDSMILMLQKDITHRLAAQPGKRDYGILSIIAQYFSKIEVLKQLPPSVFWPNPKVDSALVYLEIYKKDKLVPIENYPLFQKIVKAVFMTRRKTIYNSLMKLDMPIINERLLLDILNKTQIDSKTRGETLTIEKFIELANELNKNVLSGK